MTPGPRTTKARLKSKLKPLAHAALKRDWDEWINTHSARNGDYKELCPPWGHQAFHLKNGTKKGIGLMITGRAGAWILNGNKTAATRILCICGLNYEDEAHILQECPRYTKQDTQ